MSTDSHDRTKTSCKVPARCDEENTFDGKRIKKELGDICAENSDATSVSATVITTTTSSTIAVEKGQQPAGRSFATNGFHGDGDLLQDLVANKFATLANHSASSKQDKIRIMIEDGIRLKVNFHFKQFPGIIVSVIIIRRFSQKSHINFYCTTILVCHFLCISKVVTVLCIDNLKIN